MSDHKEIAMQKVTRMLEKYPEARNSDMALLYRMIEEECPRSLSMPLGVVLKHWNEIGLPNMKTINRTRRRVQAEFPELAASERVRGNRAVLEEEWKEFAIETV